MAVVKFTSHELWDSIEEKLKAIIRFDIESDFALVKKAEAILAKYRGNISSNSTYVTYDDINQMNATISGKRYFMDHKFSQEQEELLKSLVRELSLFETTLFRERQIAESKRVSNIKTSLVKREGMSKRFPNIDCDKAMNLFKDVKKLV